MEINNIYTVYFSATFSTKQVVNHIAGSFGTGIKEIDITNETPLSGINMKPTDLLVAGVPVYGGRVPAMAVERLKSLRGNDTPALIVCVYGNREFDDALLELNDIVKCNGFIPFSAAAIVAEHCIFPKVATARPDNDDWKNINAFCEKAKSVLINYSPNTIKELSITGKRPYKKAGKVPLHPSVDKTCNECGTCARQCPTGAIALDNPKVTDVVKCISCARCIKVCPQKSRKFRGVIYKTVGFMFVKGFSRRREPKFIIPSNEQQ